MASKAERPPAGGPGGAIGTSTTAKYCNTHTNRKQATEAAAVLARLLVGRELSPIEWADVPTAWRPLIAMVATAAPAARLAVLDRGLAARRELREALEPQLPGLVVLAQIGGAA